MVRSAHSATLRMALGGLALTLLGLGIGFVLAIVAARLMTSLLYGFQPNYAPIVAAVSVVLLAVAALALFVPARVASCIDPMIALRHE
jgi:putative ABC transport system permease protein